MLHADSSLGGIVLAAGLGSRLGGGKLLLPHAGKPILAHSLEAVLAAGSQARIALVLGHDADALRRALESALPGFPPEGLDVVVNPYPERGMGESLRFGLSFLLESRGADALQAVAVILGDQPLLRPETLRGLYAAHAAAVREKIGHPATVPEYRGRRGNPAILSRVLFPDVLRLSGDVGAREILAGLGPRLLRVPVDDPGVIFDVDTPAAYDALRNANLP